MLDTYNPYICIFRQARDLLQNDESAEFSTQIYCDRSHDARRYNTPTASDVSVIMVGDGYEVNPTNQFFLIANYMLLCLEFESEH